MVNLLGINVIFFFKSGFIYVLVSLFFLNNSCFFNNILILIPEFDHFKCLILLNYLWATFVLFRRRGFCSKSFFSWGLFQLMKSPYFDFYYST